MGEKTAPKKRGRKPVLDPELVAAAVTELSGNVAAVAKRFGVARQSVADLIDRRPALRTVARDAREGMLDNAESALYRAVLAGEAWAVCFFLKTQGKSRGYVERPQDLPPIEVLLGALPDNVAQVVRTALADAVQSRGNRGRGPGHGT
jgi:hypothetical protein